MPSANVNNLEAFLKIKYPNGIAYQGVKTSRFWSLVKKTTGFGCSGKQVKVTVSPGTGGSSTFANALQNRGPGQHRTFTVTRRKDYVIGSLENEVIKATQGDANAVMSALEDEFDKKGKEFGMRLSRRVWGAEGGSLGRVSSISTSTIVLTNSSDVRNFYPGQVLQLASDNGTGTSPAANRTGTIVVTKVSAPSTKTITFSTDVTTGIPLAAANDYIFNDGDYGLAPTGVLGWIPVSAPGGSDSFLGVNRSEHVTALSGNRYTAGAGKDMIEIVNQACAEGFPFGAEGEYIFVNGNDMARFQNSLENRCQTREVKTNMAGVSWKGLVIYTTYGELTVLPEPWCPEGYALIANMSDWEVASLGELPHFSDTGHGKLQQEAGDDARQFRLVGYWNLLCNNPANQTILQW